MVGLRSLRNLVPYGRAGMESRKASWRNRFAPGPSIPACLAASDRALAERWQTACRAFVDSIAGLWQNDVRAG